MVIFIEKFQYLVNGLWFGFYYGLRFRSNRFEHSVKRFGRFGLDTLVSRSQSMLGLLSKSQKTKILTISVKVLLMCLLYKIHFKIFLLSKDLMDGPSFLFEKELKTQANRNILILFFVVHLQYFIIHTVVFFKHISSYHHNYDVTCIKRKMLEKSAAAAKN